MQVKLKVSSGNHEGKEILVGRKKFLIGRSDNCQLRPKSESVSRRHCILVIRDNQLLVQDLKSRNGTFINEQRLPTDRAKRLQHGDILRVGKLTFEVVVDHGLGGAKKPEVKDVKEAASRTVQGGGDPKTDDVDISSWLDEADQIDRIRQMSGPDTRQVNLEDLKKSNSGDSTEISVEEMNANKEATAEGGTDGSEETSGKREIPKKGKPKKLPKGAKGSEHNDSREAAGDALKRFFSGR